jgi:hypothetical protein
MAIVGAAFGQTTSGDLVGTVKDPSGASIPNAVVTITNEETGVAVTVKAGSSGEFRASNLLPGKYDVAASFSGFQPYTLRGVSVTLNKTSTSDVTLSIGASTTVEVAADAGVVLDTTSTNLTTTFANEETSNLPSATIGGAGQSGVLNLSLLSPGVASSGGIGIGIGPSIGGQRPRNNNFELEGIDNNNKSVTGPLVYVPNDAVGNLSIITNQFSPEFGHSSGGQFNTTVVSGTNKFHGRVYEYFQNRNLNAAEGIAGGKVPNPRLDNNRYGGQIGGPILRDKLFFFANYERNAIGQAQSYYVCAPTAAGVAALNALAPNFSSTNLQQYLKAQPVANYLGGAQVNATNDNACFNQSSGPQTLTVTGTGGAPTTIPLGNALVNGPYFTNFNVLTTSVDYNINSADQLRARFLYDSEATTDFEAQLPSFWAQEPYKWYLFALSEFHTFTPNLTNEVRIGFNRYTNTTPSGNFSYPGLDQYPNLTFNDLGFIDIGPDPNAPQFTIQNLYQITDNISWVKGKHTFKFGFDGRKYISPQGFTQRARGDYDWANLDQFLHDQAPDPSGFAQRSTGNQTYYGDQTALYGYANDTWRASSKVTINAGLRYEFTAVPVGERTQSLNALASVPGLISFGAPQPTKTAFAPRVGINYAPDEKTSIRAGFGIAYDVLFDNLGTLSFPPQYSTTQSVGTGNAPAYSSPNFLANGGLPPGTGSGVTQFCLPGTGNGNSLPCDPDIPSQRAATAAYIPNQVLPYAETYTLTIQRTISSSYTAEVGYVGTRGIHLATQDQINIQPRVTAANQLGTVVNGATQLTTAGAASTNLGDISNLSNIVPSFLNVAGGGSFSSAITSYQPYSGSNYNALVANLTRRFQHGLQMNLSYTWSKTMDDATAEVFSTVLTPRRPQNSQNVAADWGRSALDRTHRITLEALYDVPFYKTSSNFIKKNIIGNWAITPIYTYESPEYATALSGYNSNLNGDDGSAIDRPLINVNGVKGTGTDVVPIVNPALQSACTNDPNDSSTTATPMGAANGAGGVLYTSCGYNTVGYSAGSLSQNAQGNNVFTPSNAYYVAAGSGTLPTASRNTLPIRPINNIDIGAYKRITIRERYAFEVGAQSFNVLNHAQYTGGSVDNVNNVGYTTGYNFQTVSSAAFNHAEKVFTNNPRTMQLTAKFSF